MSENQVNDICLKIGCWANVAEGWLNVDSSLSIKISKNPLVSSLIISTIKAPRFLSSIDLGQGLKLPSNSRQLIFASHVLGYLSLTDLKAALTHLYFYLKKEGIIKIIVPNLEAYINNYLFQLSEPSKTPKATHELRKLYCLGYEKIRKILRSRWPEALANLKHQWMWHEAFLTEALAKRRFEKSDALNRVIGNLSALN